MVKCERLPEKYPLIFVLYLRVLLQEVLLDPVQLYGINLLQGAVNVELGVPAAATLRQHNCWCLDLTDARQTVL